MRRSVTQGRVVGLVSGFGAAMADAVYATLAALSIGSVMHFILSHKVALQVVGGLLLIGLGIHMIRTHPPDPAEAAEKPRNLWGDFISVFLLTVANPQTVLTFLGFFAMMRLAPGGGSMAAIELIGGVLVGSMAWWCIIAAFSTWLRSRLVGGTLKLVSMGAGAVVCGFGLYTLVHVGLDRALR